MKRLAKVILLDISKLASSKNQYTWKKEQAQPTDSSRHFFLHPIILSNVFSRGAIPKMADI